jgi:hypothetical protein
MSYIGNFGLFDELASDPGSDIMFEAVSELNSWLGLRHKVSLVDVHTSNGCENTNKIVLQHISTLVNDLRIKKCWADPKIISLIQFYINSSHSSEAGVAPFKALFGSADETYYKLPADFKRRNYQTEYVKLLDKSLAILREISAKHQEEIKESRQSDASKLNQFQKGDLVLKSVRTIYIVRNAMVSLHALRTVNTCCGVNPSSLRRITTTSDGWKALKCQKSCANTYTCVLLQVGFDMCQAK